MELGQLKITDSKRWVREAEHSSCREKQVLLSGSELFSFFHCCLRLHHQKILMKMNQYGGRMARGQWGLCSAS